MSIGAGGTNVRELGVEEPYLDSFDSHGVTATWPTQRGTNGGSVLSSGIYRLISRYKWRCLILMPWDLTMVALCYVGSHLLSPRTPAVELPFVGGLPWDAVIFATLFLIMAAGAGLYERDTLLRPSQSVTKAALASVFAWVGWLALDYLINFGLVGRWVLGLGLCFTAVATAVPRVGMAFLINGNPQPVLFVGDGESARMVESESANPMGLWIKVIPVMVPSGGNGGELRQEYGRGPVLKTLAHGIGAQGVVLDNACSMRWVEEAAQCVETGVSALDFVTFYEKSFRKVPIEKIDLRWLIAANVEACHPLNRALKRFTDVILAAVGLAMCLPLWLMICPLIAATSKGPVFYRQQRVGRGGEIFRLIKFRTMKVGAESDGRAVYAGKKDDRVTAIGKILRRTRLDETPQFLNVLAGHMSFVGPRPERPEFVKMLEAQTPTYGLRHLIKPGITGWAQIKYSYAGTVQESLEKLKYDLYYVKNATLLLDLYILVRTPWVLMRGSR